MFPSPTKRVLREALAARFASCAKTGKTSIRQKLRHARHWADHPTLFTKRTKQRRFTFKKWRGFGLLLSKHNSAQVRVFSRGCLRAFCITFVGRRLSR